MVKQNYFIFSLVLFLIISVNSVASQERQISFHVKGGGFWSSEENIHSGITTGFGFGYCVNQNLSLVFDFRYSSSDVVQKTGHLYSGKLTVTPFMASLRYSVFSSGTIIPYIFLGTGYIFSSVKMDDIITIPEVTISQDVKNGLGFQVGAGTSIQMSRNISVFGEFLYTRRKTEGVTKINDMNFGLSQEEFAVNLSSLSVSLGLRFNL